MSRPLSHLPSLMAGVGASASIMAGYLPVAISFGLAASQAGLSPLVVMGMSVLVYAGASQFLLISLLLAGAGVWAILPMVLLMNARHVFYGPALLTRLPPGPARLSSLWLSFGLTDEVFATAMSRLERVKVASREHWLLGLQLGAYAAWVAGTALGVALVRYAADWPTALQEALSFVFTALFFALLLETGAKRWRAAMLTGGGTALLLSLFLPGYHALVLAILAGMAGHAYWGRDT